LERGSSEWFVVGSVGSGTIEGINGVIEFVYFSRLGSKESQALQVRRIILIVIVLRDPAYLNPSRERQGQRDVHRWLNSVRNESRGELFLSHKGN
jgi:hypothetical protein